ncbi:hypothetical protein K493DRAFT_363188 [Basidiobolus meristosporus CBS 931.73]|uniref:Uncharacterized protein n=1 Tax=Basidiobolus meristosporus CBS 931.73 TaxID=1314790 RepID=A0A1Y1WXD2_9FUNG|nr:hypothetical protein K493DRAFT_363188 [Basidiobolus meristosporus CBS 931.73]|eukprot:ORX77784.1 hypothetical protein K493DRAFT_363188 [Basidiobolus meristosporus CBS 931.73]
MSNYSVTAPVSTAVEQYYLPQGQIHLNLHQQLQLQLQLQQEQFQHIQQHQIQEVQTHLLQGHSRTSEITQVYADKPDLLQLVLDAKVAEDNRAYEVERRIAEKLTLESKLLDLEILREQRRIGAGYATTIDNGQEPIYQESTAKKRGRSLSHAEVMEALRNKIRAKKLGGEAVVMVSDNAPEKSAKI